MKAFFLFHGFCKWMKMPTPHMDTEKNVVAFPTPFSFWWCMNNVGSASSIIANCPGHQEIKKKVGWGGSIGVRIIRLTFLCAPLMCHPRDYIALICTYRLIDLNYGTNNNINNYFSHLPHTTCPPLDPF